MPSFPYYYLYYQMHEDENEDENQTKRKSKPHRNKKRAKKSKPLQKNRKERLKKGKKMPKMKAIFDGLIKPIIQLMIIFVPPLILHLYTIMWTYQVDLAIAILTLFPIYLIFFPYYFLYLLIWIIMYAYVRKFILKRRQSKTKNQSG